MFMLHRSRILALYIGLYLVAIFFFSTVPCNLPTRAIIYLSPILVLFWPLRKLRFFLLGCILLLLANFQLRPSTVPSNPSPSGYVSAEPRKGENSQSLIIRNTSGERFSVFVPIYPEYQIGDNIQISGQITRREEDPYFKKNPGYYLLNKIDFTIKNPVTTADGSKKRGVWVEIRKALIGIRRSYENVLLRLVPEPFSGLAVGILLGNRQYLSETVNNIFITTGIVHILALSGYNITVIAASLRSLLGRYSAHLSSYLALGGIWLFVTATGFSASVVRAAIMGSVLILARRFGRQSDSLMAILIAAAVMVALNPHILKYDIGFQLSFAAMSGMIILTPLLFKPLESLGKKIAEILASTLAAQLFTLPILSFYFGRISTVSIFANLLVLPFIPFVMALIFGLGTLGLVSLWLAQKLAFVLWLFLAYIIKVAEVFSSLPFAEQGYRVSGILLLGFYLLLTELILIWRNRSRIETF